MTQPATCSSLGAVAASVVILALTIYLLIVGEAIFIPLVLAIFITYLIIALAHQVQRVPLGRWRLPNGLALAIAALIFVLLIAVLVQMIAGNVRNVVDAAPGYQARLQGVITQVSSFIATTFNRGEPLTVTTLLEQIDLRTIVARLAGVFQTVAANTFQIVVYVMFLLLEAGTFDRKLRAMFPNPARYGAIRATLREVGQKIESYVLIKTGVSLVTGILSYVVLSLVGVDFAAFWALLLFVLNFIPYIGSLVAITLPTLLALLQFASPVRALVVLGVLIGVQVLMDNLVEPRLAGRSLNLSPIMIMLGLSVWGTMWGIIGMILSVPIMVMVMIVLSQFPRTRPIAVLMSERGDIR